MKKWIDGNKKKRETGGEKQKHLHKLLYINKEYSVHII